MNISTNHSTTKSSYQHLAEAERRKIEAYLSEDVSLKELSPSDLESYTAAINQRPRRIHNYQSTENLFKLAQVA